MNNLASLAVKHGTDKGPLGHNYTVVYHDRLRHLVPREFRMLEIGVQSGQSLRMWEEFFPRARVFGIDVDPDCLRHSHGRVTVDLVDQGNKVALEEYAGRLGGFDLVIDDGGHRMHQQILSFEILFPRMKPGGIYVIEDTHTSYVDKYGGGVEKLLTTVKYFTSMIDSMNLGRIMADTFVDPTPLRVHSVEFLKSLIFIRHDGSI